MFNSNIIHVEFPKGRKVYNTEPEHGWYLLSNVIIKPPRKHPTSKHFIKEMSGYLNRFGLFQSVVVDERLVVLGGEERLHCLQMIKPCAPYKVPVYVLRGLSAEQKTGCQKAYLTQETYYA